MRRVILREKRRRMSNFQICVFMKKHFYFAALLLTSAFTACTQDEDIAVQRVNNESPVDTRTSVVNREEVSISDISQISANFWAKQAGEGVMTKSSAPKSIREIQPILNEAGTDTLAFAVNYANNGGYILVSGTRDYYPILAYSDEGQFETDKSRRAPGIDVMLSEYEVGMAFHPDSASCAYFNFWEELQPTSLQSAAQLMAANTARAGQDYFQYVEECIGEWKADGYEVYSLSGGNIGLPADIYEDWYNTAVDRTSSNSADFSLKAFLLRKNVRTQYESKLPQMTTRWGQGSPYNSYLLLDNGQKAAAGCVTIAVAQIMKYHKYPTRYNWNAMNNSETSSTNWFYTANLIKDVADAVDADLGVTESPASIGNARDALVNEFGYSSDAKIIDHLFGDTHYSLNTYGVVYMRGDEGGDEDGHAWVCDGYKTESYRTEYLLMVIPSETGYFYEQEGSYIKYGSDYSYSHMNWGWYGDDNAWYLEDNIETSLGNFKSDRKDIINIHPK